LYNTSMDLIWLAIIVPASILFVMLALYLIVTRKRKAPVAKVEETPVEPAPADLSLVNEAFEELEPEPEPEPETPETRLEHDLVALKNLFDKGLISLADYEQKKQDLLKAL